MRVLSKNLHQKLHSDFLGYNQNIKTILAGYNYGKINTD